MQVNHTRPTLIDHAFVCSRIAISDTSTRSAVYDEGAAINVRSTMQSAFDVSKV